MQGFTRYAEQGWAGARRDYLTDAAPLAWLKAAARLPGKSMHLAVALQHMAAVDQTRELVVSNLACERFGLTRNAKYRALRSLEKASLVTVKRKLGRSPTVMISYHGNET